MGHAGVPIGVAVALLVLFVALPAAVLSVYLAAASRARARAHWSAWRIASFGGGIALVIAAGLPAVTDWAHQDLRGHMAQHLLLGMFAPLGLVLGAPGTLLLRSVPARAARGIAAFLGTPPVRALTHPVTVLLLDIGGMYLLYLTPLYALSQSDPVAHVLVHVHFLVSGYLFTWAIAGPDPAPHRPGMPTRLAVLFVATAMHANLGKFLYGYGFPRGTGHTLEELQAAAELMYYGGDLAEALLIVAFCAAWFRRGSPRAAGFARRSVRNREATGPPQHDLLDLEQHHHGEAGRDDCEPDADFVPVSSPTHRPKCAFRQYSRSPVPNGTGANQDIKMIHSLQTSSQKGIRGSPLCIALTAAGFLALAACASTPQPPSQALQAAESAIDSAEQARVADYASAELTLAREKLTAARAAVRNEDMVQARYLAEESRVHADLATARAAELKSKAVNDEMQKSIDTLKQEMQRITGVRQ